MSLGLQPTAYSTVQPGQPWDESRRIHSTLQFHGLTGRLVGVSPPSLDQRRECVRAHGLVGDYVLGGEEPRRVAAADGCQAILTGDFGDEVLGGVGFPAADDLSRLRPAALRSLVAGPGRRGLVARAYRDRLRWALGHRVRRRWQPPLPFWVPTGFARRVDLNDRWAASETKPANGPPSYRFLTWLFENWWTQSRNDLGDVDIGPRVEERLPLADLQLVELSLRIPQTEKSVNGDRRHLHRTAFADLLAPALRASTEKAEFSAMTHAHLEAGPDLLLGRPAIVDLGWVRADGLDRLRAEVLAARPTRALTRHLWLYATLNELELWTQEWVA